MKDIEKLTTGWVINHLSHETDIEKFDFTATILSQRLLNKKRRYISPFPKGEYNLYVYIDSGFFSGTIYRHHYDDLLHRINNSIKPVAIISIVIEENRVFLKEVTKRFKKPRQSKKIHTILFIKGFAEIVLNRMGFDVF